MSRSAICFRTESPGAGVFGAVFVLLLVFIYADGLGRMQGLCYELAGKVLMGMKGDLSKMVDFDACAITGSKKCDVKMYTGERGSMSYLGFIDNICLMAELESGNHFLSPAHTTTHHNTSQHRTNTRLLSDLGMCDRTHIGRECDRM